jgi:hypothetical protein
MRRAIVHFLLSVLIAVAPLFIAFVGVVTWDEIVTVPNRDDALALKIEWTAAREKQVSIWIEEVDCRMEGKPFDFAEKHAAVEAELAEIDRRSIKRFGHPGVGLQSRDDVTFLEWLGFRP